jgi:hypothetical protein
VREWFGGVIWGFDRSRRGGDCSGGVMVGHVAEILGHEGMNCNNFVYENINDMVVKSFLENITRILEFFTKLNLGG